MLKRFEEILTYLIDTNNIMNHLSCFPASLKRRRSTIPYNTSTQFSLAMPRKSALKKSHTRRIKHFSGLFVSTDGPSKQAMQARGIVICPRSIMTSTSD